MNLFKQSLALLMVAVALFTTACATQDQECTPPAVEQNIIGTWTVTGGTAAVEFKANGTFDDPNDDIIGGFINSDTLDVKTYSVANDTLYTTASSSDTSSSNALNAKFPIDKNECDKITLSIIGIPFILTRQ